MHIPDGFLDARTALATGALAAVGLGVALRHAQRTFPPSRVPLLGLSAAFVFAAQMLNFPVVGGTSGHLIGGVMTAALLGPSAGVIVISAVLIVQCFLFADGGITALGANIFNMALVGGVGGWAVYATLCHLGKGATVRVVAAGVAAWVSTILASIACAGELAASKTVGWSVAFPTMAGVHALIGVGEALITSLVLAAILPIRPDLLGMPAGKSHGKGAISSGIPQTLAPAGHEKVGTLLILGLVVSLGLTLFVAPFASPWPDGLDKTAEVLGFSDKASEHRALPAPIPDYQMPGIRSESVATGVAGVAGTVIVLGLSWMLARALLRKAPSAPTAAASLTSHEG